MTDLTTGAMFGRLKADLRANGFDEPQSMEVVLLYAASDAEGGILKISGLDEGQQA